MRRKQSVLVETVDPHYFGFLLPLSRILQVIYIHERFAGLVWSTRKVHQLWQQWACLRTRYSPHHAKHLRQSKFAITYDLASEGTCITCICEPPRETASIAQSPSKAMSIVDLSRRDARLQPRFQLRKPRYHTLKLIPVLAPDDARYPQWVLLASDLAKDETSVLPNPLE